MTRPTPLFPHAPVSPPVVVSLGLGVDSTAMLVGLWQRGERPDAILFADTGSEKVPTYQYKAVMDRWLAAIGFPPITVVRYQVQRPRRGHYTTLEEECLLHHKLPSLAYGSHSCSSKWKAQVQAAWVKAWAPAQEAWAQDLRVQQLIGFDASPIDERRTRRPTFQVPNNPYFTYRFPLIEWGWHRDRCITELRNTPALVTIAHELGLDPVPMKSACFFCPSSKPDEIRWLQTHYPDYADRIIALERNAAPHLITIEGLWRKRTKTRPASMTEFLTGIPLPIGTAVPGPPDPDAPCDSFMQPDSLYPSSTENS